MFEKHFKGKIELDEVIEAVEAFNGASLIDYDLAVPTGEAEALEVASELVVILMNPDLIPEEKIDNIPDEVIDLYEKLSEFIPGESGGEEDDENEDEVEDEAVEVDVEDDELEDEGVEDDQDEPEDEAPQKPKDEPKKKMGRPPKKEKAEKAAQVVEEKAAKKKKAEKPPKKTEAKKEKTEAKKEKTEAKKEKTEAKKEKTEAKKEKTEAKKEKTEKSAEDGPKGKRDPKFTRKNAKKFPNTPEHKDDFGYGLGSSAARINQVLLGGPFTTDDIAKHAACKKTRISPHINSLKKRCGHNLEIFTKEKEDGSPYYMYKLHLPKKVGEGNKTVETPKKKVK